MKKLLFIGCLFTLMAGWATITDSAPVTADVQVSIQHYTSEQAPGSCIGGPWETIEIKLYHTPDMTEIGNARINKLTSEHCHLDLLWIEEPYRNCGYGAQLFSIAKEYCTRQGYHIMSWHAAPIAFSSPERYAELPRLVKFYEKLGCSKSFHHDTHDNPWMGMYTFLKPTNKVMQDAYQRKLWIGFKEDRLLNII